MLRVMWRVNIEPGTLQVCAQPPELCSGPVAAAKLQIVYRQDSPKYT